jgi:hypothetical protein
MDIMDMSMVVVVVVLDIVDVSMTAVVVCGVDEACCLEDWWRTGR